MTALMVTVTYDDSKKTNKQQKKNTKEREEWWRTLRKTILRWPEKKKIVSWISPGDSAPRASSLVQRAACHSAFLMTTVLFSSGLAQTPCWLFLLVVLLALVGARSDQGHELRINCLLSFVCGCHWEMPVCYSKDYSLLCCSLGFVSSLI